MGRPVPRQHRFDETATHEEGDKEEVDQACGNSTEEGRDREATEIEKSDCTDLVLQGHDKEAGTGFGVGPGLSWGPPVRRSVLGDVSAGERSLNSHRLKSHNPGVTQRCYYLR